MTTEHTPGPWHYRPAEHDDWGIVRASNEVGRFYGAFICQAKDPDAKDETTLSVHRAAGTDPWEANARLIAAAPELLEALTEMVIAMRRYEGDVDGGADVPPKHREMMSRANTAIAKAKGAA